MTFEFPDAMEANATVLDVGSAKPVLRSDLAFTLQARDKEAYYLVEDPLHSRFLRLGRLETALATMLDGETTLSDALERLSTQQPGHGMSEFDAVRLVKWLHAMSLLAQGAAKSPDEAALPKNLAKWNPLFLRTPLGNPDKILERLTPWFAWVFHPVAVACWIGVVALGAYTASAHWDAFRRSGHGMFAPTNWAWLIGAGLILKVIHETAHGVACKRYGGRVRETGILFVLFAPLAYVDVTSSWRFREKRQKLIVDAAGVYVELFAAAIAVLLWSRLSDGWSRHLCFNIAVAASVHSILFNANPLMRFDGYFALSDLLAIPNLYGEGQAYTRYLGLRLLGADCEPPQRQTGHRGWIIRTYGVAALVWRIVICCSLLLAASVMFDGGGLVLALIAGLCFAAPLIVSGCRSWQSGLFASASTRWRLALLTVVAVAITYAVFFWIPWPGRAVAHAIVEYPSNGSVRSGVDGFVKQLYVRSGDRVRQGQLLVQLENPELDAGISKRKLEIAQLDVEIRRWEQEGKLADQQSERERRVVLCDQLQDLEQQRSKLSVTATRDGFVVGRGLDSMAGTYVAKGDELLTIGEEDRKELTISIRQEDVASFEGRLDRQVRVDLYSGRRFAGVLNEVDPRASLAAPHPALTVASGGPLPIRAATSNEEETELFEPRFSGCVHMPADISRSIRAGQRGEVSFRPADHTIGAHLYQLVARWIRSQLNPDGI